MMDKRLLNVVPDSKKYIMRNVLYQWGALAANIVMMWNITALLASLLVPEPVNKVWAVIWIVLAVIVRYVCAISSSRMSYLSSKAVKKTLREKIYQKLLRLGVSYKEQVKTSEIVQVAVEGVDQLETYFGAYLPQFFYAMIAPLTLFVVLCFVKCTFCHCAFGMCAYDTHCDCCGSDLGEEAVIKILGSVYSAWRYFP